jgi:RNA polymerase sigma factor (sigma-70 family)
VAAVPEQGRANGRVASVSPEALHAQRLYERYGPRVFGLCLARLGNRADAEDAAQTTFLQALGSLSRGTKPTAEAGWLLTIAQNVCIARWRDGHRARVAELPGEPRLIEALAPAREHDALAPHRLIEAVGELPEQQRRAILLREWQGLSYREIADELGVSVAAVETMIFRARRRMATSPLSPGSRPRRRYPFRSRT